MKDQAIVIGSSAGGMDALKAIFSQLSKHFPTPIIVVQHLSPNYRSYLVKYLLKDCALFVKELDEKEKIQHGTIYIVPPNYHVLIEQDETFTLSVEERVNFTSPPIDVLFESAAAVFQQHLKGIILTGAGRDGSQELKRIKERGGLTIVQDSLTAYNDGMPKATIATGNVDLILTLDEISARLIKWCN